MNEMLFDIRKSKEYYYDKCYHTIYISMLVYATMYNRHFRCINCYYDSYFLPSCINEYAEMYDKTIKNFYKQNKENKKIINRVKIFTKKRKLCNDIRNLIISFLITPPKIYSLQIY